MADITDHHEQTSPDLDDSQSVGGNGNPGGPQESRGVKRQRAAPADDDDDDDDKGNRERRKIEIKFISDKSRRHITFSKRKAGIMKKVSLASLSPLPLLLAARASRRRVEFAVLFVACARGRRGPARAAPAPATEDASTRQRARNWTII